MQDKLKSIETAEAPPMGRCDHPKRQLRIDTPSFGRSLTLPQLSDVHARHFAVPSATNELTEVLGGHSRAEKGRGNTQEIKTLVNSMIYVRSLRERVLDVHPVNAVRRTPAPGGSMSRVSEDSEVENARVMLGLL